MGQESYSGGWICKFCGRQNSGGNTCTCGAGRSQTAQDDAINRQMSNGKLFLLKPENQVFLEQRKLPRSAGALTGGCLILFLIPFVLAGIFVAAFGAKELYRRNLLDQSGVTVEGKYTDRWTSSDDDSDNYYVSYQFNVNDRQYNGEEEVDWERYKQIETGGRVSIVYLPTDPTISSQGEHKNDATWTLGFGVCWSIVVIPVFIAAILGLRQNRILFRTGRLLPGEIVDVSSRTSGEDDGLVLTVKYIFHPPDAGRKLTKSDSATRNDLRDKHLPPAGTPVAVLYRNEKHFKML